MPLNVFFHAQPSPTRASTSSCHHHNDITATSCYWAVSYGAMTPVRRDRHDDATAAPSGAKGSASVETAGAASATPTHRSSLGKGRILQPNVMQMIGFVQRMGQLVLGHGAVNAWSGRPVHPHPTTSTSSCPGRPGVSTRTRHVCRSSSVGGFGSCVHVLTRHCTCCDRAEGARRARGVARGGRGSEWAHGGSWSRRYCWRCDRTCVTHGCRGRAVVHPMPGCGAAVP